MGILTKPNFMSQPAAPWDQKVLDGVGISAGVQKIFQQNKQQGIIY